MASKLSRIDYLPGIRSGGVPRKSRAKDDVRKYDVPERTNSRVVRVSVHSQPRSKLDERRHRELADPITMARSPGFALAYTYAVCCELLGDAFRWPAIFGPWRGGRGAIEDHEINIPSPPALFGGDHSLIKKIASAVEF